MDVSRYEKKARLHAKRLGSSGYEATGIDGIYEAVGIDKHNCKE